MLEAGGPRRPQNKSMTQHSVDFHTDARIWAKGKELRHASLREALVRQLLTSVVHGCCFCFRAGGHSIAHSVHTFPELTSSSSTAKALPMRTALSTNASEAWYLFVQKSAASTTAPHNHKRDRAQNNGPHASNCSSSSSSISSSSSSSCSSRISSRSPASQPGGAVWKRQSRALLGVTTTDHEPDELGNATTTAMAALTTHPCMRRDAQHTMQRTTCSGYWAGPGQSPRTGRRPPRGKPCAGAAPTVAHSVAHGAIRRNCTTSCLAVNGGTQCSHSISLGPTAHLGVLTREGLRPSQ